MQYSGQGPQRGRSPCELLAWWLCLLFLCEAQTGWNPLKAHCLSSFPPTIEPAFNHVASSHHRYHQARPLPLYSLQTDLMVASQEERKFTTPHSSLKNLAFSIPLKQISLGGGNFNLPPSPQQSDVWEFLHNLECSRLPSSWVTVDRFGSFPRSMWTPKWEPLPQFLPYMSSLPNWEH